MLKKLRRKFILINMSLVTLVLLIVFAAICFSSYRQYSGETMAALRMAASHAGGAERPKPEIGGKRPQGEFALTPVFCATLEDSGAVLSVLRENVEVSDDLVRQAVEQALASGKQEGTLSVLNLRFLRQETPEGTKIAFADRSGEQSSLRSLLLTSLLVGAGGLAAFFVISLFLSGWALRPVERAWEQQRQFVADASHELKTPLTVILANTGILLSHRGDAIERQVKWVEHTKEEADRMKRLVDDLLFLAKSDAARTPMVRAACNFSELAIGCALLFEPVAFEQGLTLETRIDPGLTLTGDEGQLRQLLMILLDNACKYASSRGRVALSLCRAQDKLKLAVNNTGDPIPQQQLSRLFERFYRADDSRSRGQGGSGLGLAIAKSIVDQHGGKVWAESSEQAGTTFTVLLPAK